MTEPEAQTARAVERVTVRLYVYVRLVNLAQVALALPTVWRDSSRPIASLLAAGLCVVTGASVVITARRRGRLAADRFLGADAVASLLALGTALAFVPTTQLFTWVNWPYPVSLLTGAAVALTVSLRISVLVASVLMAGYLANAVRSLPSGSTGGLLTNSASYLGFAVVAHVVFRYMRHLAVLADAGRAAERELALERARRHVHGPKSLLDLLTREDLDPEVRRALRADAVRASAELQSFLSGMSPATTAIAAELRELTVLFTDLPLTVNVDALDVDLSPQLTHALLEAVRTALQNVRQHAQATSVVLYAESDRTCWEVTVNDNGRGFAGQGEGFGLTTLVRTALDEVGASTGISSTPGLGTTVTLRGML